MKAETHLCRKGEKRIRIFKDGRDFSMVKKLGTAKCPFTNLPEKKASRWGESLTVGR